MVTPSFPPGDHLKRISVPVLSEGALNMPLSPAKACLHSPSWLWGSRLSTASEIALPICSPVTVRTMTSRSVLVSLLSLRRALNSAESFERSEWLLAFHAFSSPRLLGSTYSPTAYTWIGTKAIFLTLIAVPASSCPWKTSGYAVDDAGSSALPLLSKARADVPVQAAVTKTHNKEMLSFMVSCNLANLPTPAENLSTRA
mmetsp:Transcript_7846/g.18097  ORF Transcript_7846/g.18097 Transcript_7846/m.18097 type:complete len:200 (-) Transcript_7846:74-673(-)